MDMHDIYLPSIHTPGHEQRLLRFEENGQMEEETLDMMWTLLGWIFLEVEASTDTLRGDMHDPCIPSSLPLPA